MTLCVQHVLIGYILITTSNCDVTIHSTLPSICYASSTTSCSGNLVCSTTGTSPVEWLYPNFTVITTRDEAARVYGNYFSPVHHFCS